MAEWVAQAAAARATGRDARSLRQWRAEGLLPWRAAADGGVEVDLEVAQRLSHDRRRARGRRETYRVVSLWDVHVPDHDERAVAAVLDYIADARPDCVVLGGDIVELASMSQHGGDPRPPSYREDIDAGRRFLARVRAAAGADAEIHYLEGNHETRAERTVIARLPELHGAVSVAEALALADLGIGWSPYRRLWRPELPSGALPRLWYTHGEWAAKHHAAMHLDRYGVCVRYGHTHRPQVYTRGYADGVVRIAIGSPCLRTLDPSWAGSAAGWCHGFGLDEFMADGTFTALNVVMTGRRFAINGRVYG